MFIPRKKIWIGVLVFIGLIGGLILFNQFSKSHFSNHCYNNIQDKGEEGVDCGGSCPNLCIRLSPISVLWVKIIPAGSNNNHLAALIKNPNDLYGASQFSYRFSIIDAQGKTVLTRDGNSYILPHSTKYLFAMNIGTIKPAGNHINLDLGNFVWQQFNAYQEPTLLAINQQMRNIDEGGFKTELTGRLVNNSVYDLRTVKIKVVLYSNSNNPIAISETHVGDLLSKERRDFRFLWKKEISRTSLSKVDIRPETNVFQEDNFLRDYKYQHINVKYNERGL